MNALWIITVFDIIDELMKALEHRGHVLAQVPDAEILTVAVVSAKSFPNHHERTFGILQATGYLSGSLSVSRFNRCLHALADWLPLIAETLGEICATGEVFVIDSIPVPVCPPCMISRRCTNWPMPCRKARRCSVIKVT